MKRTPVLLALCLFAASLPLLAPAAAQALTSIPGFTATYEGTNAAGVAMFSVVAANDGPGPQALRVLLPAKPAPGVAHNFLFVLPVEPGLGAQYGDGLATVEATGAQNADNLTVIEPTFADMPWYADSTTNPDYRYESFMTSELLPWVRANLSTTGHEKVWLLGFSKSGLGAQDLLLKHPGLFSVAASWDFPADMTSTDAYGSTEEAEYGSEANYADNYELTPSFVAAHKAPFTTADRIWVGGYALFQKDVTDYGALLTTAGIEHMTGVPVQMVHRWDSGWVPDALAALEQLSAGL